MWTTARTYLVELITLPATILIAQLLSPFDFGVAAIATFFGRLAARVSNAGMGSALVRVKVLRDEHVSSIFVANLAVTAIAALALLGMAPYIARFYRAPEVASLIPLVTLDFVFSALSMVSQALLTRSMRYREMATLGAADTITAAVASVLFAWFGLGYWSIVLGAVCGSGVKWAWGVKLVGWQVSFKYVPSAARELLSFAAGTYTRGLLEYVSLSIDNLIVGRVLGVTALGFYDKAFSSAQRTYNKLTVGGPSVSFRALAMLQDEPERFQRAFEKIVISSTLVTYGVFAVFGAMGPHIIVFLFGEKWRESIVPFQLLCLAGALKASNAFGGAAANAKGWIWSNVWRQAVQMICIAVGVYVAAPWGINGAALAVVVSAGVMFLLTLSMVRAATGLGWLNQLRPHVPGLSLALILGGLVWGIDVAFKAAGTPPHVVVLLVQGAVAALAAAAALRWTPFPSVAAVVHEIASDVSPKLAAILAPNHQVEGTVKRHKPGPPSVSTARPSKAQPGGGIAGPRSSGR